jgi:bifunctional DNA-binding transcriptional regulator/antitoxin component of YhaV-PrlF toxin-antitoxin module
MAYKGAIRQEKAKFNMPLTEEVSFKAMLQKGNRVQIPKLIRWQFKMEPQQVLKVKVNAGSPIGSKETFYAKMSRDGRIAIPKLTLELLRNEDDEESLVGSIFEVQLEPAKGAS